jgi:cyclopropane fatty-acyl-phospholipid synthase-like methyltransferase
MPYTGNTEKQAILRDEAIRKSKKARKHALLKRYLQSINAVLKSGMKLLDIGYGTAHVIQELAKCKNSEFVGLDLSAAIARALT